MAAPCRDRPAAIAQSAANSMWATSAGLIPRADPASSRLAPGPSAGKAALEDRPHRILEVVGGDGGAHGGVKAGALVVGAVHAASPSSATARR
jgi:hypothetical protein